jgi:hypothetical protein
MKKGAPQGAWISKRENRGYLVLGAGSVILLLL